MNKPVAPYDLHHCSDYVMLRYARFRRKWVLNEAYIKSEAVTKTRIDLYQIEKILTVGELLEFRPSWYRQSDFKGARPHVNWVEVHSLDYVDWSRKLSAVPEEKARTTIVMKDGKIYFSELEKGDLIKSMQMAARTNTHIFRFQKVADNLSNASAPVTRVEEAAHPDRHRWLYVRWNQEANSSLACP